MSLKHHSQARSALRRPSLLAHKNKFWKNKLRSQTISEKKGDYSGYGSLRRGGTLQPILTEDTKSNASKQPHFLMDPPYVKKSELFKQEKMRLEGHFPIVTEEDERLVLLTAGSVLKIDNRITKRLQLLGTMKDILAKRRKMKSPHLMRMVSHGSGPLNSESESIYYILYALPTYQISLMDHIRNVGAMNTEGEIMAIAKQIAQLILTAHQHKIALKTLRTETIFLERNGNIVFVDPWFTVQSQEVVDNLVMIVCMIYFSIEKTRDWWRLGIVLYECFVGMPPFQEEIHWVNNTGNAATSLNLPLHTPTKLQTVLVDLLSCLQTGFQENDKVFGRMFEVSHECRNETPVSSQTPEIRKEPLEVPKGLHNEYLTNDLLDAGAIYPSPKRLYSMIVQIKRVTDLEFLLPSSSAVEPSLLSPKLPYTGRTRRLSAFLTKGGSLNSETGEQRKSMSRSPRRPTFSRSSERDEKQYIICEILHSEQVGKAVSTIGVEKASFKTENEFTDVDISLPVTIKVYSGRITSKKSKTSRTFMGSVLIDLRQIVYGTLRNRTTNDQFVGGSDSVSHQSAATIHMEEWLEDNSPMDPSLLEAAFMEEISHAYDPPSLEDIPPVDIAELRADHESIPLPSILGLPGKDLEMISITQRLQYYHWRNERKACPWNDIWTSLVTEHKDSGIVGYVITPNKITVPSNLIASPATLLGAIKRTSHRNKPSAAANWHEGSSSEKEFADSEGEVLGWDLGTPRSSLDEDAKKSMKDSAMKSFQANTTKCSINKLHPLPIAFAELGVPRLEDLISFAKHASSVIEFWAHVYITVLLVAQNRSFSVFKAIEVLSSQIIMAERALNSSVSLSPSHEKSYESSTFDVFSTSTGNVNSFSSPATNTRTTSGFAVAASSISRQQRRSPKTPPLHSQRMNKTISTSGKLSSLGAPAMPGTLLSPSQIRYARYAESILKPNSMEEVRVSAQAAENIKLTYVRILGHRKSHYSYKLISMYGEGDIENLFAESKCSVNVKGDNYILFFDVTKEKPFTKPQPVFSVCFNTAFIKRRSALLLRDIDCNDEDLLPFITPNKLQVKNAVAGLRHKAKPAYQVATHSNSKLGVCGDLYRVPFSFFKAKSGEMSSYLLIIVRFWSGFLAIFEFPNIYAILPKSVGGKGKGFQKGPGSNLPSNDAVRRLWCFMLTLLVISRVCVVIWPRDPRIMANAAAVHLVEAIYFGSEYANGCYGPAAIIAVIYANAVLYAVTCANLMEYL
eukprot:jgi/Bigna1/137757/aug1.41_g12465